MTLKFQGQPLLLQIAMLACVIVNLASFFTFFVTTIVVISKIDGQSRQAENHNIRWGERAGQQFSQFSRFLVDDEFKSLRQIYLLASLSAIISLGLIMSLIFVFGEKAPH
jgi:hypothetical protein